MPKELLNLDVDILGKLTLPTTTNASGSFLTLDGLNVVRKRNATQAAQDMGVLDGSGKYIASKLPDLAITEVIPVAEQTLADFAANSNSYIYQEGDVIIITTATGDTEHYIYKGGTKTDVNEYSLINNTQIDWGQIVNTPDFALDSSLDNYLLNTTDDFTGILTINGGANDPLRLTRAGTNRASFTNTTTAHNMLVGVDGEGGSIATLNSAGLTFSINGNGHEFNADGSVDFSGNVKIAKSDAQLLIEDNTTGGRTFRTRVFDNTLLMGDLGNNANFLEVDLNTNPIEVTARSNWSFINNISAVGGTFNGVVDFNSSTTYNKPDLGEMLIDWNGDYFRQRRSGSGTVAGWQWNVFSSNVMQLEASGDLSIAGDLSAVEGSFTGNVSLEGGTSTLRHFKSDGAVVDVEWVGDYLEYRRAAVGTASGFKWENYSTNLMTLESTGDLTISGDFSAVGGTFSGNVQVDANLTVSNTEPILAWNETDTSTYGRIVTAGGTHYFQVGANGAGQSGSAGSLRFSGLFGGNIGEFKVQSGGAGQDILHEGNYTDFAYEKRNLLGATDIDTVTTAGTYQTQGTSTVGTFPTGVGINNGHVLRVSVGFDTNGVHQELLVTDSQGGGVYKRYSSNSGASWSAWGKGFLTADTDYVPVSGGTFTGKVTFNNGTTNEVARFESTDGGAFIQFADSNTTAAPLLGANGNNFVIWTSGTEQFRVNTAGNVEANGATFGGQVEITDGGLKLDTTVNASGVGIDFSDQATGAQRGTLNFYHTDSYSPDSAYGATFEFDSTESALAVNVVGDLYANNLKTRDKLFVRTNNFDAIEIDRLDSATGSMEINFRSQGLSKHRLISVPDSRFIIRDGGSGTDMFTVYDTGSILAAGSVTGDSMIIEDGSIFHNKSDGGQMAITWEDDYYRQRISGGGTINGWRWDNFDNTPRMTLTSSGSLLVNTASGTFPTMQLTANRGHVTGSIGTDDAILDLYNDIDSDVVGKGAIITFSDNFYNSGGSPVKGTRAAIKGGTDTTGNTADGFLAFYTDSGGTNSCDERMRITHDGYVGINKANPNRMLDVVAPGDIVIANFETTGTSGLIDIDTGGIDGYSGFRYYTDGSHRMSTTYIDTTTLNGANTGYWQVGDNWAAGGESLIVENDTGFVGIGKGFTTPDTRLHVKGETKIGVAENNWALQLENESETAFKYRIFNNGSAANTTVFQSGLYYNSTPNATIKYYRGGSTTGGWLGFTVNDGTEKMRLAADSTLTIGDSIDGDNVGIDFRKHFTDNSWINWYRNSAKTDLDARIGLDTAENLILEYNMDATNQGRSFLVRNNGTTRFQLDANGNGIFSGTLLVASGAPLLVLRDTTDNDDHAIRFEDNLNNAVYQIDTGGDVFNFKSIGTSPIDFSINGTSRLNISQSLSSFSGIVEANGFTTDNDTRFYAWTAVDNSGTGENRYVKIGTVQGGQSTRFIIQLGGKNTSYSDGTLSNMGYIVGQLNNDNNWDVIFYDHTLSTGAGGGVVDAVGHVNVTTTTADIYVSIDGFSEVTASGHISGGTITVDNTDVGTTQPTGFIGSPNIKVFNSNNITASDLDSLFVPKTGGTFTGQVEFDGTTLFDSNSAVQFRGGTATQSFRNVMLVRTHQQGTANYISVAGGAFNFNTYGNNQAPDDLAKGVTINGNQAGTSTIKVDDNLVFHAGNDGAGSGLDADLLDGQQGSAYLRSNATDIASEVITFNKGITMGTTANNGRLNHNIIESRDKIRVWNSGSYAIGMESAVNFGSLSDFAMTFQMDSTNNRGFWWGDVAHSKSQGAMSLTTDGRLTVASYMRLGYGQSDTTATGTTYRLQANGSIQASAFFESSDIRKKENISEYQVEPIDINLINYNLIEDESKRQALGVSAQELEEKHERFVNTDENGDKSVHYVELLLAKVAELEQRIKQLENNG